MRGVYVLELGNGMRYIGSSRNVPQRIQDHYRGLGSGLTKEFGVRKSTTPLTQPIADLALWEQKETLTQMKCYGFDKVRGSCWTYKNSLTSNDREMIRKLIIHGDGRCWSCGNIGHTVTSCYAKSKAKWLVELERGLNKSNMLCERCGRKSHNINNCYANTHISGKLL